MKKILSVILSAMLILSLSIGVSAEDKMPTKAEAKEMAHELIELFNASSAYELFDDSDSGNWYALEDYLSNQIYMNPKIYDDWFYLWSQSVDTYSNLYVTEELRANYEGEKSGMFGISILAEDGFIKIVSVAYGSPAEKAGILSGAKVISYDDVTVPENATSADSKTLMSYIAGVDTISFKLKLPTGETKDFTITRGEYNEDAIMEEMTITDGTAYLIIPTFNNGVDETFAKMWQKAEDEGAKSVIIDLRNNGGGYVDICYNMLNTVIPEKLPIYYDDTRDGFQIATSDGLGSKTWRPDIVILVSENTASAAEQFAGTLKYHGYARLVGETTYGKGIGQFHIDLSNGKTLAVTAMKGYLPNGYTWNGTGLKPTVAMKDDINTAADEVLDYAYTYVDGVGAKPAEADYYGYTYNLPSDISPTPLNTFAYIKQMRAAGLDKPVRFTLVSSNGMKMIVDAEKAYEAAYINNYFGIYGDQSVSAEAILKKSGNLPEKGRVIMTAWEGDYGFTPTLSLEMADAPKYFYYYDSVNDVFTEFKPAFEYEDGVLRVAIRTGGIIIATPEAVK
jgi:carboxyl-terminal processing protease